SRFNTSSAESMSRGLGDGLPSRSPAPNRGPSRNDPRDSGPDVGTPFSTHLPITEVHMTQRRLLPSLAVGLGFSALVSAQDPQKPKVQIPNPGVSQIMTLEDR